MAAQCRENLSDISKTNNTMFIRLVRNFLSEYFNYEILLSDGPKDTRLRIDGAMRAHRICYSTSASLAELKTILSSLLSLLHLPRKTNTFYYPTSFYPSDLLTNSISSRWFFDVSCPFLTFSSFLILKFTRVGRVMRDASLSWDFYV